MRLFRRHLNPGQLGAMLYERLRAGLASESELSMDELVRTLGKNPADLDPQYAGEVMVGLMFSAWLAIERSASPWVSKRIFEGMKLEFQNHLVEQGASAAQRKEWMAVLDNRFAAYRETLEGYTGFEPPWKLGRLFFWNIIGVEEHIAMSVKIATLFMMKARDECQEMLNEYGPVLTTDRPM